MLDNKLIESTLQLTGKSIYDLSEWNPTTYHWHTSWDFEFSIEKFCYYLLSPEFIWSYYSIVMCDEEYKPWYELMEYDTVASDFWKAIRKYQKLDEQPLIELLSKIK